MNSKYAFYMDSTKCMGCKACMIACKDAYNLPLNVNYRRVAECVGGDWFIQPDGTYSQNVFAYYLSVSCNHCNDPKCVAACPTGATHKNENGLVVIDASRCVGCKNCSWNCPYSAPQFNEEKQHMTKCDFCADRLAQNLAPVCVLSCPARALDFGPTEELIAKYGRANIAPLPPSHITQPNLAVNPHQNSVKATTNTTLLANKEEM
ncbi:DMSO/selenate family reductase complex B subunit [Desulfovibrio litoralis]|uniref:Anaerobic dimethyl sulfoxide reductase subunit B (DMSO reductase iron-sulfur subunit) n=1 Tax=Desulfovibrio litoralis DSM 11393 TaxID=1121455 RepID=A0A1M7TCP0_9BACT|nr:DMSO/selenate family reductase complex B subunit [Desulfovibrio litoralis]SHN68485.1 anaerobic dimethyl sulfoxide reductase subunit B (DMSO reductase iron-sulfur subunit) [Desulfovibrio litoralis DSM 11393]